MLGLLRTKLEEAAMQIKYLHPNIYSPNIYSPNIYRLYAWARTQECLDVYRRKHEDAVRRWPISKTSKKVNESQNT